MSNADAGRGQPSCAATGDPSVPQDTIHADQEVGDIGPRHQHALGLAGRSGGEDEVGPEILLRHRHWSDELGDAFEIDATDPLQSPCSQAPVDHDIGACPLDHNVESTGRKPGVQRHRRGPTHRQASRDATMSMPRGTATATRFGRFDAGLGQRGSDLLDTPTQLSHGHEVRCRLRRWRPHSGPGEPARENER